MVTIFGLAILPKRQHEAQTALLLAQTAEIKRLRDVEAEYKRLTDRDSRGRYVKNEV